MDKFVSVTMIAFILGMIFAIWSMDRLFKKECEITGLYRSGDKVYQCELKDPPND